MAVLGSGPERRTVAQHQLNTSPSTLDKGQATVVVIEAAMKSIDFAFLTGKVRKRHLIEGRIH